jgi:hypothetical protein
MPAMGMSGGPHQNGAHSGAQAQNSIAGGGPTIYEDLSILEGGSMIMQQMLGIQRSFFNNMTITPMNAGGMM